MRGVDRKGNEMLKRTIRTCSLVGMAFVALASASDAVSATYLRDCETPKHHFQILRIDNTRLVYRSWNRPKKAGMGMPDLELVNGESDWEQAGDCSPHE